MSEKRRFQEGDSVILMNPPHPKNLLFLTSNPLEELLMKEAVVAKKLQNWRQAWRVYNPVPTKEKVVGSLGAICLEDPRDARFHLFTSTRNLRYIGGNEVYELEKTKPTSPSLNV